MQNLKTVVAALWVLSALVAAPAFAKPATARPAHAPLCCRVAAGTMVEIALAEEVSTKIQKTGDTFALKLAEPLIVDGRVILRAGTPGVGEIVQASKPGMGGKAAKLVLAARYLEVRGAQVPLQGLQLAAAGKDKTMTAQAVGLSGIAFGPLGFIGLAVQGGNVDFPAGTSASAELATTMNLASLGLAPRGAANAELALESNGMDENGAIVIPPPPTGRGQVVFFRAKSLMGTGQWFNVREHGEALGKLSNGAYFVEVADPGIHTYTASLEPEAKDQLKLEIDPGLTYFVEGTITKGLAIGDADLSPSNRDAFDKASAKLKPAAAPTDTATSPDKEDLSQYPDANAATNEAH